ncbi:hypothetical protein [Rufibacter soli]
MTNPEATEIIKAKFQEFRELTITAPPAKKCGPCPGCQGKEEESLRRASQFATTNQMK